MFVCLFAITYVATKYRRRPKKPQKNALSPLSATNTLSKRFMSVLLLYSYIKVCLHGSGLAGLEAYVLPEQSYNAFI